MWACWSIVSQAKPSAGHWYRHLIRPPVQFKAFQGIGIFALDRWKMHDILLRLALSDNSDSSKLVLHSALAFSSIHRFGPQSEAARLKAAALKALDTSSREGMDPSTVVQHVAAQMMLGYVEVGSYCATACSPIPFLLLTRHLRYKTSPTVPPFSGCGTYVGRNTSWLPCS